MPNRSIVRIKGFVKDYAWGNSDFIPSLIGGFSGRSQAEYWMGTHRNGHAVLDDGTPLVEYIQHDLRFLFKILAIADPLAIQCHPNTYQAMEGWMREAKLRDEGKFHYYSDSKQKSKAFIALTPVSVLYGFLPMPRIIENLSNTIPKVMGLVEPLCCDHMSLYSGLFSLSPEKQKIILYELDRRVARSDSMLSVNGIIRKCLELYPRDIGCLFPLIMNLVLLEPGEGLFMEMGVLHAYCFGNGVEVMTNSENVLRCALTRMRVDHGEIRRIAKFEDSSAVRCQTRIDDEGRREFLFPVNDFRLVSIGPGEYEIKGETESVGIVLDGYLTIRQADDELIFNKGESFYIASGTRYHISSNGTAFFAR